MSQGKALRPVENSMIEAEMQQTAYQLFMRMPDLSLRQVAKKMQLAPELVETWAARGDWEQTRRRLQLLHKDRLELVQEQMQKINARDAYEHLHKSWKILRRVLHRLDDDNMMKLTTLANLQTITRIVKDSCDIEKAIRDRLGIADVPMN